MAIQDLNSCWNFVEKSPASPKRSGEDATLDHFRSIPSRFVVREYIQNSMDAKPKDSELPVKVVIRNGELPVSAYPNLLGSLKGRMKACKDICDNNQNSQNPYKAKVDYLQENTLFIPYLEIADYNTTGMPYTGEEHQCGFTAGVRSMGSSHKESAKDGGSHGFGKAVGFVATILNAVYYSTKLPDGQTFGEGVIRLCDHKYEGKEYLADAFFDSHDGFFPDSGTEIPESFRRDEVGTSAFIIGAEFDDENYFEDMVKEALRSFYSAIAHDKLEVEIGTTHINSESIANLMEEYFPNEYDVKSKGKKLIETFNPHPYYLNCLDNSTQDENHIKFESNEEEYPNLGHATLYVYKNEGIKNHSEDHVVYMRDKEMVIIAESRGTYKGYYAMLIVDGKGSEILRAMENVTHDAWVKPKRKDNKELYEQTKRVEEEYKRFVKESIDKVFPENDSEKIAIPLLNRFIMTTGSKNNTKDGNTYNDEHEQSDEIQGVISTTSDGVKPKRIRAKQIGRAVIRRKGGKKKRKASRQNGGGLAGMQNPVPTPNPNPQPPTPNPPNPKPAPVPIPTPPEPEPEPIPVPAPPKNPIDGVIGIERDNGKYEPKNAGTHAKEIDVEFRVVVRSTDTGPVHRIIIASNENYESCSMAVEIAGEEKNSVLQVFPENKDYHVSGKNNNIISDFNLQKGKNYIDIRFSDNDFHSLILKAYES